MAGNVSESAFSAVAGGYDADFTFSPLGRILRRRVWAVLSRHVEAGDHLLELACGSGEDAVWLGRRGVRVTATDGAAGMVRIAQRKVGEAGLNERVTVSQMALQEVGDEGWSSRAMFDAVLSNFGGLNTIDSRREVARGLAEVVRPGGRLVLVVMGPLCPWEVGWHLLHGEWRRAMRRFDGQSRATVGGADIPVWYPSHRRLQHEFAPWFRPVEIQSLGLWLPPSYLGHLVARFPRLFAGLERMEVASARWTGGSGDHYILVLER